MLVLPSANILRHLFGDGDIHITGKKDLGYFFCFFPPRVGGAACRFGHRRDYGPYVS